MPDLESELLSVAMEAGEAAAVELRARFGERARGVRSKSTPTDLVSDADLAAESAIRAVIGRRRPEDTIMGEEGGQTGAGELRWLVDPLDGTVNFLFGIPAFVVSVACEDADGGLVGVVLDPVRGECFTATRWGAAMLNEEPIRGSSREELSTAMLATGFAYEAAARSRQAPVVARVIPRVRDIRRVGAAAMDLAWTACGRFDAYYERGVKPWDVAAGTLIAARAGLVVRELPAAGEDPAGVAVAPVTDPRNPSRRLQLASDSARYDRGGTIRVEAILAGASAATADAGKAGLQLSLQRNGAGTVLPAPARLASSSGAPTFVGTYPVADLPLPSGPGAYTLIASWTVPDGSGTILTAQLPIEIDG